MGLLNGAWPMGSFPLFKEVLGLGCFGPTWDMPNMTKTFQNFIPIEESTNIIIYNIIPIRIFWWSKKNTQHWRIHYVNLHKDTTTLLWEESPYKYRSPPIYLPFLLSIGFIFYSNNQKAGLVTATFEIIPFKNWKFFSNPLNKDVPCSQSRPLYLHH